MNPVVHPDVASLISPHYQTLQGYVSAGMESDKNADIIFLNANENPYPLPGVEQYNRYPEPQPKALREGYGKLYNAPADHILMTRGADEAIAVLARIFCEPGKGKALVCGPTFGMYKVHSATLPADTINVPLIKTGGTFALDVDGVLANKDKANIIFLCTPNNPTGTSFAREDILRIIREARGHAMVVVDETYSEFSEADSLTAVLGEHPNLVILRTLSKSFSLAGMRMGSLICADLGLAHFIRTKGLDAYPLPRGSIEAALHVLKPEIQVIARENIKKILAERVRMEKALASVGDEIIHVYPSDANFLLIEMKRPKDFAAACAQRHIIVRDFSSYEGTQGCIRLTIGTPAQNDQVLAVLEDF